MDTKTKTTRISALLPTAVVEEVKRISYCENVTQSYIIKKALEQWLRHRLEQDAKYLAKLSFEDLPSEDEWVSIQSKV